MLQWRCVKCDFEEYKPFIGEAPCLQCPVGKNSLYRAATDFSSCLACPQHSLRFQPSEDRMGCECVTGYTGNVTGVTNSLAENRCWGLCSRDVQGHQRDCGVQKLSPGYIFATTGRGPRKHVRRVRDGRLLQ